MLRDSKAVKLKHDLNKNNTEAEFHDHQPTDQRSNKTEQVQSKWDRFESAVQTEMMLYESDIDA